MIREIFGKKIGMTQIFDPAGSLVAVTLVEVEPVCVLEKIEYPARRVVRVGMFKVPEARGSKIKQPVLGYFKKLGLKPYGLIKEVEIAKDADFSAESEAKREIGVELFEEGENVKVRAKTKGRGFAGGMKRHNWSGQPGSHGSTTHRRVGSIGGCSTPSRVWKGLGMPGHMGDRNRTIKNLKVLKVDKEKNLLFIQGAVPGSRGTLVEIKKQ